MERRAIRRTGAAALVALAAVAMVAPASGAEDPPVSSAEGIEPAEVIDGAKSATSRLAETDPALLGRTDATPIPVLVKLDYDSLATYQGGIADLAATSPAATGTELSGATPAEQRYEDYATVQEDAFVADLAAVVPEADVGTRLRTVYGGVAATVPANRVADIAALPNVVAVQADELRQLLTDSSTEFIGADALYPELGGTSRAGEGTIIGVLDSGAWPEHPSFTDQGLRAPPRKADGTARTCDFGDNPLTDTVVDVFRCNNKLIGGAAFLDSYNAAVGDEVYESARDSDGHGTHTASTAAGNALGSAPVLGVDRGPLNGVAPGAWVSVYKVCGAAGCFGSDSAAAVEQAVLDGVDVINFSISGGTNPFTDPVELAFLDAYAAGVFVAASAGNSGPTAGTANHLSPWVTTVAASTQDREFVSTLTLTSADGTASATFEGASIAAGAGPAPVVLAETIAGYDARCLAPAAPGVFAGVIVACRRGSNGRVEKGDNVLRGGAIGMVLYNPTLQDVETDNHWLPTVHLPDGTDLLAFLTANPGAIGQFTAGVAAEGQGDVMAAFSSRGPAGLVQPDVTAPGVSILAGHTPTPETNAGGPPGQYFQAIAGTSMSSPHVAGAALLLRAYNPEWTPGQIKSALMTTATTAVVKEDLVTPADPFDLGAGRIDLTVAAIPGLTFDETAEDMAALGGDPLNAVHLNVASVNAPQLPGRVSTQRRAANVSGVRMRYDVSVTSPADTTISVFPSTFALDPGDSVDLSITIETIAPKGVQQFGEIRLTPRRAGFPALHLPVAFVPQQGDVTLTSSCVPSRIPQGGESACAITAQNGSLAATTVDLVTTVNAVLRVDRADGATVTGARRAERHDVALGPVVPVAPTVRPGASPGYVPLAALGVAPRAIGDETIVNYNVPPFVYGGKTHTRVGVDSNGYLVVGGATADDNECCRPVIGSPVRPNNVLAPFWTDLDGTGRPGLSVAVVSDAVSGKSWLAVEWQVRVWGTTSNRGFQVWIGVDGVEDISFAYDPAAPPAPPTGQDYEVGAENEYGQGGEIEGPVGQDLVVTSPPALPGESITYTVYVRGARPGAGIVTTEMNSPGVLGTTIVTSPVNVRATGGRTRLA